MGGWWQTAAMARREKRKGKGWLGRIAHGYVDAKLDDAEKAGRLVSLFDPVHGKILEEGAKKARKAKGIYVAGPEKSAAAPTRKSAPRPKMRKRTAKRRK